MPEFKPVNISRDLLLFFREMALRELGLNRHAQYRYKLEIESDTGDLLWSNQYGSYTRKRHDEWESRNSTAYYMLRYLATVYPDIANDPVITADPSDMLAAKSEAETNPKLEAETNPSAPSRVIDGGQF